MMPIVCRLGKVTVTAEFCDMSCAFRVSSSFFKFQIICVFSNLKLRFFDSFDSTEFLRKFEGHPHVNRNQPLSPIRTIEATGIDTLWTD
jgi:hypothetical protein